MQMLQMEIRKVMAPNTAQKLKERKNNSLKDYSHVASLLKVTHLMLLAPGGKRKLPEATAVASDKARPKVEVVAGAGALLKIARLPSGPTLTMRVERYSLSRMVRETQKVSYDVASLYDSAPLVVLNNFGSSEAAGGVPVAPHIKLMRITFQNMFPSVDVATVRLADCR
jgi:ribosome biogenesis protein SSF1/2